MTEPDSTDDQEKELEALRAQVETLKSEAETSAVRTRTRRRWGRGTGAVILILIAGLLLPSAVSAVWANRLISNTDRYVQTVSPLAEDPAMQAAITNRITTEIEQYVNVQDLASTALTALSGINGPLSGQLTNTLKSQLPALAGPIASGVNGFIHDQVAKIVASPQFATAWDQANRIAHKQLVAVLTGKGSDAVSTKNGAITLNLAPFIQTIKADLVARGFSLASNIPAVNASFVLFQSAELVKAQTAFSALNTTAWVLPLIVVLLLVGGVLLAPSRRRGFVGAGLAVFLAMVVALAALSVGRIIYLHHLPTDVLPGGAAGSAFDIVTRFLKQGLRMLAFFGLVIIASALLAGPASGAVAIRRYWTGALASANQGLRRLGLRTEPAAPWVDSNALLLRIILVVVGVVVLLLWSYPTPKVAIWLTVAVLVGFAVVDFLRAPVVAAPAAATETPAPA